MTNTGVGRPFRAGAATLARRTASGFALLSFWLAFDAALFACPICFQVEDGPVTDGVRAAVIVLMSVTGAVLSGFALFIARFVRRTR